MLCLGEIAYVKENFHLAKNALEGHFVLVHCYIKTLYD